MPDRGESDSESEGMSKLFYMDTYLMGAAGLRLRGEQAVPFFVKKVWSTVTIWFTIREWNAKEVTGGIGCVLFNRSNVGKDRYNGKL